VNAADADLLRRYQYAFDLSGNRTQQIISVAGSPTTTNYTYNAANQLTSDGVHTLTYDNNGNMTSDGTNSYTWDRANRLLSMGGSSYAYDGEGRRVE
jgi:predicted alpha/beta hydrolase